MLWLNGLRVGSWLAATLAMSEFSARPLAAQTNSAPVFVDAQASVDQATILITPGICAGVIVGDVRHAITAAHCLSQKTEIVVETHDGERRVATVVQLDRGLDVALLRFDRDVDVEPLSIATRFPRLGDALYFGGRADRRGSNQIFAVVRVGPCPSLPSVANAIFTNLRAKPGDSGAPMVNKQLEVVGLVHGGASCNIAAPVVGLGATFDLNRRESTVDHDDVNRS